MTPATVDFRRNTTSGKRSAFLSLTPTVSPPGQRPPLFVPRDELFYWTREWQEGEHESAEARAAGELRTFQTARDAINWLKAPEED